MGGFENQAAYGGDLRAGAGQYPPSRAGLVQGDCGVRPSGGGVQGDCGVRPSGGGMTARHVARVSHEMAGMVLQQLNELEELLAPALRASVPHNQPAGGPVLPHPECELAAQQLDVARALDAIQARLRDIKDRIAL